MNRPLVFATGNVEHAGERSCQNTKTFYDVLPFIPLPLLHCTSNSSSSCNPILAGIKEARELFAEERSRAWKERVPWMRTPYMATCRVQDPLHVRSRKSCCILEHEKRRWNRAEGPVQRSRWSTSLFPRDIARGWQQFRTLLRWPIVSWHERKRSLRGSLLLPVSRVMAVG